MHQHGSMDHTCVYASINTGSAANHRSGLGLVNTVCLEKCMLEEEFYMQFTVKSATGNQRKRFPSMQKW
jgi:hypothetical protein